MEEYVKLLRKNPIDWILEKDNPSVRYFALKKLLDKNEQDPEVLRCKRLIMSSSYVKQVLSGQDESGFWIDSKDHYARVKFHGSSFRLILLAELGADGENEQVKKACEYILKISQEPVSGGFGILLPGKKNKPDRLFKPIPCLTGNTLWSLVRLGYARDPRIAKAINWCTDYYGFNDGDLAIPDKMKPYTGCWENHSCIYGVSPVLRALAEIPLEIRSKKATKAIQEGTEFVLKHNVYKRSHNLRKQMTARFSQLTFPQFNGPDFLQVLESLSRLKIRDDRMADSIRYLLSKQNENGRWKNERNLTCARFHRFPFPYDQKGSESKWITLRALTVLRQYCN